MQFKNINDVKAAGFSGFKTVKELWNDHSVIPNERGVYVVLLCSDSAPKFLVKSVGGLFKMKDPTVATEVLNKNWISNSCVVYIGQAGGNGTAATLRKRIKQYLDFGEGKPVGHYGGRFIWQLSNHPDLILAWKPLPNDDPKTFESQLINEFKRQYTYAPFANLT